jgi:uncharacterized protein involved in exopolysaccharide biosynthesis
VTQARKHEIAPVSGIPVLPSLPAPNAPVLTLRQAVEALFRGKWFILAVALIGIFAGTWSALSQPNEYESQGSFRFRAGAEGIRVDPAGNPADGIARYSLRENAEAILLSEELLRRVVERAGPSEVLAPYEPRLRANAGDGFSAKLRGSIYAFQRWLHKGSGTGASFSDALLALRQRLRVWTTANSDLLHVRLAGNDAERTQKLLNQYMEEAQLRHQEVYDASSLIAVIEQNYQEAAARHEEARQALRSFMEANGIRDFATDFAQSQQDLRTVSQQVEQLQRQVNSYKLTLEGLRKQLGETERLVEVQDRVPIENPRIAALRTRISGYEADLEELRGRVKETDKSVVSLKDTLDRTRKELEEELAKPAQFRLQTRFEENVAWGDLRTRITTIETQERIDRSNLPDLLERQKRISKRNDELSKLAGTYHELNDELTARTQELSDARARLGVARTKRELAEKKLSSLQIFDPPNLPLEKVGPRRTRIVLGGLLGGLFAAIAFLILRALTDRKIHGPEDLEKKLGIKVLATVPLLNRRNVKRHQHQRVTSWS